MANRYWVGGNGTWDNGSTNNWSAATALTFTASCSGTVLTTTGSPALVAGMTVFSSTYVSLGTIVSGSVNTWVVSVGGTYASQSMQAATIGASAPTALDSVFFDKALTYTVTLAGSFSFHSICLDLTVSAGTVTFSDGGGGVYLDIWGSTSLIAGTIWTSVTYITFKGTSTITTNGVSLASASFTFDSFGSTFTLGRALVVSAITMNSGTLNTNNYTLTANNIGSNGSCTVSFGSSTINTYFFALNSSDTCNAGTSTINLTGAASRFTGGGLTYYNVNFTALTGVIPSGYLPADITGSNTFNNLTITADVAATSFPTLAIGGSQTISGTFTATGASRPIRLFVYSSVIGTARTITTAAVSLTDVDFRDITTAGAAGTWTGTSLGNAGGNTGITFTATKTVYWNLAGSQNWVSTGWCTASGGTPAIANYPLPQDTAVIDQNSAITTLIINGNWNIGTLDMSLRTSAVTVNSTSSPAVYGSWKTGTGVTYTGTTTAGDYGFTFSGRTTQQLTSSGKTFDWSFRIDNVSGTVQLQDALTTTQVVRLTSGTLDLNGKTLTTGSFDSSIFALTARTLAFGAGNIACSGTGDVWNTFYSGLTITGTPVVNVTSAGATAIAIALGTLSEANSISFNFTGGTYALTFLGTAGNTAKNVNFTGYAGTWGATSTATIYGNLTLSTGMTLTASASAMTFGATSGTQTITSNTKTMDFPITINGNSATTIACADALTLGSTRALTFSLGTLQLKSSATSTVGSFVTSGTTLKYLQSTTSGTRATISDASGTNTATYLSIQDSAATGGATWTATSATNVNAGNNTGWTFASVSSGNFFLMFD